MPPQHKQSLKEIVDWQSDVESKSVAQKVIILTSQRKRFIEDRFERNS